MQLCQRLVHAAGLCVVSWLLGTGRAEDSGNAKTLEAFFRARGYEPVQLELTAGNNLVVQGTLGARKIKCLIDTGWPQSSIEAAYVGHATALTNVARIGIDPFGAIVSSGQMRLVALETLKLGRCQFMGQPVDVIAPVPVDRDQQDAPTGSRIPRRSSNPQGYALYLGWDFMVRNFAVIDCNRAVIYFRGAEPSSALQATIKESLVRSGFDEIPLQKTNSEHAIVIGRMKGQEVRFLVDTGSFATLLDHNEVKKMGLISQNLRATVSGAGGGTSRLDWLPTDDIQLANHRVGKFKAGVSDLSTDNARRQRQKLPPLTGLIGMDLLSRDEALIDCQSGRMFLRSHGK